MPKLAANLTMLFNEVDFLERFGAAAKAGFEGVEYLFPYDYDKNLLREQLQENHLTQVLHNLPAGNWAAGERGIGPLVESAANRYGGRGGSPQPERDAGIGESRAHRRRRGIRWHGAVLPKRWRQNWCPS